MRCRNPKQVFLKYADLMKRSTKRIHWFADCQRRHQPKLKALKELCLQLPIIKLLIKTVKISFVIQNFNYFDSKSFSNGTKAVTLYNYDKTHFVILMDREILQTDFRPTVEIFIHEIGHVFYNSQSVNKRLLSKIYAENKNKYSPENYAITDKEEYFCQGLYIYHYKQFKSSNQLFVIADDEIRQCLKDAALQKFIGETSQQIF